MRKFVVINLHVDVSFPALTDLVDYLRAREQQDVDTATATITQATVSLHQSNTGLKGSVATHI